MLRGLLVVACSCILMWLTGCGEDLTSPGTAQDKVGFEKLFNGRDLTGWEKDGNAKWFVEDGTLVGTQGENNAPGDLFTKDTYRDFLLTVTYRTEWPCNSGIWFRYQSPQTAYQADILEYKNPECYSGQYNVPE